MLRIAIQKEGRLAAHSVDILHEAGLEFETGARKLLSPCRNFPLEILFVRDDDIPLYVMGGTADLGIIGQNVVWETEATVETVQVLPFGYCKLAVAVLKESPYQTVQDLQHKTIATSYPHTVQRYFAARQIEVNTVEIAGSVELTPTLGVSDAIVDIVSSGSTLVLNDLRMVEVMAESQACLIGNRDLATNREKAATLERLLVRLKGVLAAKEYKYVIMNVRETDVPKIIEVMPGLKSPSISKLGIADLGIAPFGHQRERILGNGRTLETGRRLRYYRLTD